MSAQPTKTCAGCRERKPWSEFWAKAKWADGSMRQPHSRCKDCLRQGRRERDHRYYRKIMRSADTRARRREIARRSKRKLLGIPPERWRVAPVAAEGHVWLPIGPFRSWLLDQVEQLGTQALLANALGLDAKTVHRWIVENKHIDLDHADQAFCRRGEPHMLRELYPEVYDLPELAA